MLKYDYIIKRDEGDEIKDYVPNIPTELENLITILGPNSSGKSTLLNLIALGFFAEKLDNDQLNPALKEKIEDLKDSNYQKLKFTINLTNDISGIHLRSEKKSLEGEDFSVFEIIDGIKTPINAKIFREKYKLIYDIPINPLERLPELLKEIKIYQNDMYNKVRDLRSQMDDYIREIRDGKDPKLIDELKNNIEELDSKLKEKENELNDNILFLKKLKKYYFVREYVRIMEENKNINNSINETSNKMKNTVKIDKIIKKNYYSYMRNLFRRLSDANILYNKVKELLEIILPREYKLHLKIWEGIDYESEIKNPNEEGEFLKETQELCKIIDKISTDNSNSSSYNEIKFLQNLYDLLNNFSYSELIMPGTDKNIAEFMQILDKEIMEKRDVVERINNITQCNKYLVEILELIIKNLREKNDYDKIKNVKRELKDEEKSYLLISSKLEKLENDKKQISALERSYANKLMSINIEPANADIEYDRIIKDKDYSIYNKYTESQLNESISIYEAKVTENEKSVESLKRGHIYYTAELKRLENKERHKYQNYLKELENKREMIFNKIETRFADFNEHINTIIDKKTPYDRLNDEEKNYANGVSEFLAAKIRFIKHIDKNYEIINIDVLNRIIKTKIGKKIRFNQLGTGQGQGAYLDGLLSINDDKKLIALIDEVAMMDSSTLEPIFNKLKKLYFDGKLLLGIIVQRQDKKIDVKTLI